jgi:hypothetical protein
MPGSVPLAPLLRGLGASYLSADMSANEDVAHRSRLHENLIAIELRMALS